MRKDLELLGVLKPGEPGTEELVEQFGDALVCVRYWYDAKSGVTLKTAEIIEARRAKYSLRQGRGRILGPKQRRRKG
jgi:hypothetical protein